jgi:hypothetical protein
VLSILLSVSGNGAARRSAMKIYIHLSNGSLCEHPGLADHIEAETYLERMGYEIFPGIEPWGDYGKNPGRLLSVRNEDNEYGEGEYDVAEIE